MTTQTADPEAESSTLDVDTISKMVQFAKSLPIPMKPFKCESCGGALYILCHTSIHGVGPCPACGEVAISGVKLRNLIATYSGGYLTGDTA